MSSKRPNRARILGGIAFIALVAGCAEAPPTKAPEPSKQPTVAGVITPEGWVQEYNAGGQLVASRDGYGLQLILVGARSSSDAFPAIKKGVSSNTLPSEVAELHIANIKAAGAEQMEVLENEPAQIAGLSGYRLLLRHFDDRGLELRRVVYGAVDEKNSYRLTYEAPALYFFERDLPAFESMVNSFQRYSDFDTAVKSLKAGAATPSSPRWAAVRLDPPPPQKKR
jgi:hypothetical protein